ETLEFATPPEQLDNIIEALDELLSDPDEDEDEDEDEDVDGFQKPLG
ncbi:MAG: hypothetical protein JWQ29_1842, partial [Phenylobacterium sp.]|nr:hypothetical protein [Phenylobacterium sp.]